ncbi:MAG: hypothetical protein QM758_28545 [Armatimonas sp.]
MKRSFIAAAGVAALAAVAFAAPNSGLNPGESVTPFHPRHVVGPLAGTNNCFPCTFQNRPQVQVWVNGDNPQNVKQIASTLATAMDSYKAKEFKAMVVFVAENPGDGKLPITLKQLAKDIKSDKVALSIVGRDDDSLSNYKINLAPSVKNTVLVYKNWQIADKMVNLNADEKGKTALNTAIAKITK